MTVGLFSGDFSKKLVKDYDDRHLSRRDGRRKRRRPPRGMLPGGIGGGADIVLFEITEFVYGLECEACNANVLMRACNSSTPDTIEVFDEAQCFFSVPEDLLIGARGFAVKMKDVDPAYDDCKWVVISLCCVED